MLMSVKVKWKKKRDGTLRKIACAKGSNATRLWGKKNMRNPYDEHGEELEWDAEEKDGWKPG